MFLGRIFKKSDNEDVTVSENSEGSKSEDSLHTLSDYENKPVADVILGKGKRKTFECSLT